MEKYNDIKIKKAKKFHERLIGNMFKKNIKDGILFEKCKSIHTFFMKESIDVIATDINDSIIKTYKNVKPWKVLIAPKNTKNIYELPKGTLK